MGEEQRKSYVLKPNDHQARPYYVVFVRDMAQSGKLLHRFAVQLSPRQLCDLNAHFMNIPGKHLFTQASLIAESELPVYTARASLRGEAEKPKTYRCDLCRCSWHVEPGDLALQCVRDRSFKSSAYP